MKICLVTSVYPPNISGPATQTLELSRVLSRAGHDCLVVTFGEPEGWSLEDGVRVLRIGEGGGGPAGLARRYAKAFSSLSRILRKERPQVLHYQSGVDYLCVLTSILLRLFRVPSVVKYAGDLVWERMAGGENHTLEYDEIFSHSIKSRFLRRLEQFALSGFSVIWATSAFQRRSLTDHLRVDEERIESLPNYASVSPPGGKRNRRGDQVVVLSVCRFARWKRLDLVILAFHRAAGEGAVLRIVGGGNPELEHELRTLSHSLGLDNRVRFVGPLSSDLAKKQFEEADIFVSASTYEPFGIVFLEAMAAGLPVVAPRTGGIPEVVEEGCTGLLVEPGDVDDLAKALAKLARDPALRERLGSAGPAVARKFSLEDNLDRILALYERALGAGSLAVETR